MIPLSLTLAILLILIGRLLVVFGARFAWNDPGLRRIVRGLVGIAVVCVIISILPLLWFVPSWLLNSDPNVKYLKPKEYFDTANGIRTAFVSAIGIPLGIGALYFTWQQLATARHQTLDQLELARNAQIADRFTKAVDQLGSEALDVRIGGIYALGQIMQEKRTEGYHRPIIDILSAYLRNHHPWHPQNRKGAYLKTGQWWQKPKKTVEDFTYDSYHPGGRAIPSVPADILAIISILRKRPSPSSNNPSPQFDLGRVDFRHADFTGMDLRGSQLQDSNFAWAGLHKANLANAKLEGAILNSAELREANFDNAHLDAAELLHAHLADPDKPATRASFRNTDLRAANLTNAKGLEDSDYLDELAANLGDDHVGPVPGHPERGTTLPEELVIRYWALRPGKQP
jgi:hypothetical protein